MLQNRKSKYPHWVLYFFINRPPCISSMSYINICHHSLSSSSIIINHHICPPIPFSWHRVTCLVGRNCLAAVPLQVPACQAHIWAAAYWVCSVGPGCQVLWRMYWVKVPSLIMRVWPVGWRCQVLWCMYSRSRQGAITSPSMPSTHWAVPMYVTNGQGAKSCNAWIGGWVRVPLQVSEYQTPIWRALWPGCKVMWCMSMAGQGRVPLQVPAYQASIWTITYGVCSLWSSLGMHI